MNKWKVKCYPFYLFNKNLKIDIDLIKSKKERGTV